jgi:hypothetical protein
MGRECSSQKIGATFVPIAKGSCGACLPLEWCAFTRLSALERETQRNVELIWLAGRLTPDFKTIADFRKDNGNAIRRVCREFIVLCRELNLFSEAIVAIDGSKFKAVNNREMRKT